MSHCRLVLNIGVPLLTALVPLGAIAQPASPTPACAQLLTAEELKSAVGVAMKDMGARSKSDGESMCPWMLSGAQGFKTVAVQFYELNHIKNSSFQTLPAFFEEIVAGAEGVSSGNKRERIPGVGQQAVFLAADPQVLSVVQRTDGVARIVGNNLTKAQITAVARAVAAP